LYTYTTGGLHSASAAEPGPELTRQPSGRVALWIAATAITAAARIEGDRHWLSDTMAGAALGVIFVAGSLAVLRVLEKGEDDDDEKI
jgi:membrane-associated phospholipid phosphatase